MYHFIRNWYKDIGSRNLISAIFVGLVKFINLRLLKFINFFYIYPIVIFIAWPNFHKVIYATDNCNFYFNFKGTVIPEKFFKTQLGKETYTAEIGLGHLIINKTKTFGCEFILIYNEVYNDENGTVPMLTHFQDFVFDSKRSRTTMFEVVREEVDWSKSEILNGYLERNGKKYEIYMLIRYTDEAVSELKKNKNYPLFSNLKNIELKLRDTYVMMYNMEKSKLLKGGEILRNLQKIHKIRGSMPNFGIFFLANEDGQCGHIWILVPKTEDWLIEKDHIYAYKKEQQAKLAATNMKALQSSQDDSSIYAHSAKIIKEDQEGTNSKKFTNSNSFSYSSKKK